MRFLKNTVNGRILPYTERLLRKGSMVECSKTGDVISSGSPQKVEDCFNLLDKEQKKSQRLELKCAKLTKELESYIKIHGRLATEVIIEGSKKMDEAKKDETPVVKEPEAPKKEEVPKAPEDDEATEVPKDESSMFIDYDKKMLIQYLESQHIDVSDKDKASKSPKVKELLRVQAIKVAKG